MFSCRVLFSVTAICFEQNSCKLNFQKWKKSKFEFLSIDLFPNRVLSPIFMNLLKKCGFHQKKYPTGEHCTGSF